MLQFRRQMSSISNACKRCALLRPQLLPIYKRRELIIPSISRKNIQTTNFVEASIEDLPDETIASNFNWEVWKAKNRLRINSLFSFIKDNSQSPQFASSTNNVLRYRKRVLEMMIDSENWQEYLNTNRRDIIKSPLLVFDSWSSFQEFDSKLEKLEVSPVSINMNESANVANSDYDRKKFGEVHKKIISSSLDFHQAADALFEVIISRASSDLKEIIQANRVLSSSTKFSVPHEWYPYARMIKRKIFYHGGPTNSGKTYHAIQRLKDASPAKGGGLYCGPLRLLALEIYEQMNKVGIYTDLITGQEKRTVPGATHSSCTLEMVPVTKEYDVAVVDEIQMIADPSRGSAWTRALLGLRAREIHLCGGLEAADLVKSLCESTGDDFELVKYERLSPLEVESESLKGDYSKVQEGDCIVAFSTHELFAIRKEIEKRTKHKCAIIYGQLPPETRSMQARLFNDENSKYKVLVASDAIGMGLNLNIRRIIFHTTLKNVGNRLKGSLYLDPFHVKQIAGRAGRKSSKYAVGKVTTWQEIDLAYVRAVLNWDVPQIKAAGIFPSMEQIDNFHKKLLNFGENLDLKETSPEENAVDLADAGKKEMADYISNKKSDSVAGEDQPSNPAALRSIRLSIIISRFLELSTIDNRYFLSKAEDQIMVANWLHTIPMDILDMFIFANAPVNSRDGVSMNLIYSYAAQYALNRTVPLNVTLKMSLPKDLNEFSELCSKHNTITLYLWLSMRFPNQFTERDISEQFKATVVEQIERTLSSKVLKNDASLTEKYRSLRDKLMNNSDYLPPLDFGVELREETKRNIDMIPKKLRVITDEDYGEGDTEEIEDTSSKHESTDISDEVTTLDKDIQVAST